jgi:uncharacterized protein (DUF427 family)
MPGLKDYAAFYWNRMDSWWEEDEEIFKHARDPKKRVDVMLSHRPVRVVLGGEVVAQTSNARFVFETNHPVRYYLPAEDVRMDLLSSTERRSQCPYKGIAHYFSGAIGGDPIPVITTMPTDRTAAERQRRHRKRLRDGLELFAGEIDHDTIDRLIDAEVIKDDGALNSRQLGEAVLRAARQAVGK